MIKGISGIVLIYLFIGGIWILFSDAILSYFIKDVSELTKFQTYKGWFYVSVTGLLLYFLIKGYTWKLINSQRRIKELYSELNSFIQLIPDGIVIISQDFKVLWTNTVIEKLFNQKIQEGINIHCYEIFYKKNVICEACPVKKAFENACLVEETITYLSGLIFNIRAVPIFDEYHKVSKVMVLIRDVTKQKKTEEQLIQSQKMEAAALLANGIAHDFNNLLTPIVGFSGLVASKLGTNHSLYPYVEHIHLSAEKAKELVKRLLAFSKKDTAEFEPLYLDDLLKDFGEFIHLVLGENIKMVTELNAGRTQIFADKNLIEQVLMNLVTNAKDAMPEGGILKIATSLIKIDETFVNIHGYGKPGRYVLLSISDTGHGMDEEVKQRIFEPFFTTKEVNKGTGLGLSVVYNIVQQHNGYINVHSELQKGTTFELYFPVFEVLRENSNARGGI